MFQVGALRVGLARRTWGINLKPTPERAAGVLRGDELSPDSYIFPPLAGCNPGRWRAFALAHCTNALGAAVWQARRAATCGEEHERLARQLHAISFERALEIGERVAKDWYVQRSRFARSKNNEPDVERALDAVQVLDDLVGALYQRRALSVDTLYLTKVAFHAGLHPVYLCPEAASCAELFTVSGWLGFLDRGRHVLMPNFVAEYWQMLLDGLRTGAQQDWAPDAFLYEKARSIIGIETLQRACAETLHTGSARLAPRRRTLAEQGPSEHSSTRPRLKPLEGLS